MLHLRHGVGPAPTSPSPPQVHSPKTPSPIPIRAMSPLGRKSNPRLGPDALRAVIHKVHGSIVPKTLPVPADPLPARRHTAARRAPSLRRELDSLRLRTERMWNRNIPKGNPIPRPQSRTPPPRHRPTTPVVGPAMPWVRGTEATPPERLTAANERRRAVREQYTRRSGPMSHTESLRAPVVDPRRVNKMDPSIRIVDYYVPSL